MFDFVVAVAGLSLSIVCAMLVLHKDYEDGLVGRIALAGMSLAGFGRAATIVESGFSLGLSWVALLMWLSTTLFMARHLYRFLKWRSCGDGDWRQSDSLRTGGKLAT